MSGCLYYLPKYRSRRTQANDSEMVVGSDYGKSIIILPHFIIQIYFWASMVGYHRTSTHKLIMRFQPLNYCNKNLKMELSSPVFVAALEMIFNCKLTLFI